MKKLINLIKKSKRVGIIAHTSPDPDCMSSLSALSYILRKMDKQVDCFIDSQTLENNQLYNLPASIDLELNVDKYDTLISVDIATPRLMGKYYPQFKEFKNSIVIDHHFSRDLVGGYTYVDDKKASCSEIIYEIALALKAKICPELATIMFAGIIGDTNCFQNDNTNHQTHMAASGLYALGADTKRVIYLLTKKQTMQDIKLKELVYKEMVSDGDVAYFIFTTKMQKEIGTDNAANLVNEILNMEEHKFSFIIKQKEKNTYLVSLRCKFGFNVAAVAEKFGGGGHSQAAGLAFVGAPTKTAKEIVKLCHMQLSGDNNV